MRWDSKENKEEAKLKVRIKNVFRSLRIKERAVRTAIEINIEEKPLDDATRVLLQITKNEIIKYSLSHTILLYK